MPRTSEKSLASNVKGYVKLRAAEARPEKRRFSLPTRFRYGFHIVILPKIKIMGRTFENISP
jgi:hypothetical protein